MMKILLIDKEMEYGRQLGCRVAGQFPQLSFYICHDKFIFTKLLADQNGSQYLCFYNPSDFPDLEKTVRAGQTGFSHSGWKFCRLVSRSRLAIEKPVESEAYMTDQIASVQRTGDYSKIAQIIENWCKLIRLQDDAEIEPKADSMFLYLDLSGTCCDRHVVRSLTSAYKKGYRTLYLPLMPLYQMRLVEKPDKGPCLSDLLLKMSGEIVADDQISHYWQSTSKGWYQFRPPAFSDDVLSCSSEQLRKLIGLIKTRILSDTDTTYALLDCRNIAFDSIRQFSVLCNHVFIRFPAENTFAFSSAEKEAARLINQLPASCSASIMAAI